MINPIVLFFGTASFLIAFVVHILIWRIIKPTKQIIWLIAIFVILPILVYFILFYFSRISIDYQERFITYPFNISFIIIWHFLLSVAYIMSYPAIQVDCPSLKIILVVSTSMPQGLTLESISAIFSEDNFFSCTLCNLVMEVLIYFKDGKFLVAKRGRF